MASQRHFATPAYLVGLGLMFIPVVDIMTQVFPFRLSDPRWRFGVFGLLSNSLMIVSTGLLVVFLVTALFDHPRLQKALGAVSLIVAVLIAGLFVIFALDALQVRPAVQPAAKQGFTVAAITATLKAMLGILTFGSFGLAAFRAPKLPRPAASSRPNTLIMGSFTDARASGTDQPPAPPSPAPDSVGRPG